ncbi:caspase domain-containing protein [Mycena capillaripes]|nr:caspase domain-containing protein [Mycena capillaripes]
MIQLWGVFASIVFLFALFKIFKRSSPLNGLAFRQLQVCNDMDISAVPDVQNLPGKELKAPSDTANVQTKVSTPVASNETPKRARQTFALIVGINDYDHQNIKKLRGCINDAHAFKKILETHPQLLVPAENVKMLTDKHAGRQAILDAFRDHLIKNDNIQPGDALVFFYAGHGSRSIVSPDLKTAFPTGWVQTICACNERMVQDGKYIPGIPHFVLHRLFQLLAKVKGNNILAIFDSCHSEGAARGDDPALVPTTRSWIADDSHTVSLDTDEKFFADLERKLFPQTVEDDRKMDEFIPQNFAYKHMTSHVLLAACRDDQTAHENDDEKGADGVYHGRFTRRLLSFLRDHTHDLATTTYELLHHSLGHWPEKEGAQDPQVEGENKACFLLDMIKPRKVTEYSMCRSDANRTEYFVAVGSELGVVVGTRFRVTDAAGAALGYLLAKDVTDYLCILVPEDSEQGFCGHPFDCKASVCAWNRGAIKVLLDASVDSKAQEVIMTSALAAPPPRYTVVESNADVEISQDGFTKLFKIRSLTGPMATWNAAAAEFALHPDKYKRLPIILNAVANFRYLLEMKPEPDAPLGIQLDIHLLSGNYRFGCALSDTLVKEQKATLTYSPTHRYGFTIRNYSNHALFPYLIYFDPTDYSIEKQYLPPSPTMKPPLSVRHSDTEPSEHPIGYGKGVPGFRFTLPDGGTTTTGFSKVFVSSKFLDFNSNGMLQDSPFGNNFDPDRGGFEQDFVAEDVWDAVYCVLEMDSETRRSARMHTSAFVLLVGLDKYQHLSQLRGCVNDVHVFQQFLDETFRAQRVMPHFKILLNREATRAAILDAFKSHLICNERIHPGDPIIFFFAGHGSRPAAPDNILAPTGYVQTICPHDEGSGDGEGAYIHGIPHYTLHELFLQLAAAKGNNVTAIFDSCHSEGASRNDLCVRFSPPLRPIPASLDVDLFTGRSVDEFIPTGFLHKHMESHVLLAACCSDQLASEEVVEGVTHGRFTANLLRCLQNAVLAETSYLDVVRRVGEWAYQTPQVEGANKDRAVFSDSYPRATRLVRALTPCKQRGLFQVDIGSACGVVTGTEFRVFSDEGTVGCLVAQEVEPHRSILKALDRDNSSAEMPENAKVVVSSWNHSLTKMALAPGLDSPVYSQIFAALTHSRDRHSEPQFVLVTEASAADIELRYAPSNSSLTIGALQSVLREEKVPAPTFPFVPARLADTIDAIAHFHYFLDKHSSTTPIPGVTFQLHSLTGNYRFGCKPSPDLLANNRARLRDTNTRYAFTVCNTSFYSLFAWLLYFDPNDYSISALYVPPSPTMKPPLAASSPIRPPSKLAIGYGRGVPGFKFTIPPGRTSDTGFLKLIVSTKYIDLKWILQESPLGKIHPERIVVRREIRSENVWDTFNAVVEVRVE